jgi:hypothetical protein
MDEKPNLYKKIKLSIFHFNYANSPSLVVIRLPPPGCCPAPLSAGSTKPNKYLIWLRYVQNPIIMVFGLSL